MATAAATHASSAISAVASRLLSSPLNSPSLPPERPYNGPDLLSSLTHDLHAHIFTFLPLRALFASSRLSSTFATLPSHPTCDELYRQQLFDPFHAQLCSDRSAGESWRSYVNRVVDVERRLVSGDEDGVLYDVGGCDEDHPHRGPRMYVGAKHYHAANYDSNAPLFWSFEETDDTPFPLPGLLVLRNVCWLQVECLIRLPSPPLGHSPFRYRVYWRLGVSEKSNLGGPTFSVGPVDDDAPLATSASRVVYNDQLRRLIQLPYTHIPGVGDEQPPAIIPMPTEEAEGGEREQERRPRNQADVLMGGRPQWMRRSRRIPVEDRHGPIRPERVMRELLIGEVEVRARESSGDEAGRREGKEEKEEEGEERTRVVERGQGCGDVRMWVRCIKIGAAEAWKVRPLHSHSALPSALQWPVTHISTSLCAWFVRVCVCVRVHRTTSHTTAS